LLTFIRGRFWSFLLNGASGAKTAFIFQKFGSSTEKPLWSNPIFVLPATGWPLIIFPYLQHMKQILFFPLLTASLLTACHEPATKQNGSTLPVQGTWQLISGTTITQGVDSVTDYTKGQRMIKIIGDDHFAFLKHDLNAPADSSNHFEAGGGRYTLEGNVYTEHLDYFADRNWEGKTFRFTVSLQGDTLVQQGTEKVEGAGIDREIIEKYVRAKE
jgi:hypothetical protein